MSQRRDRRFRDASLQVGRGSKRRVRSLRMRAHTQAGLVVFLVGLAIAAIGLALMAGQCGHVPAA